MRSMYGRRSDAETLRGFQLGATFFLDILFIEPEGRATGKKETRTCLIRWRIEHGTV
jgi:hypothetical protein